MKLVIVESPTKTKKIKSFLGDGYVILASLGHIIDLPQREMGIDIKNNFEPHYVVMEGKTKTIKQLKEYFEKCNELLIATDPDREGEAIAWHIARELGAIDKKKKNQISYITNKYVKRVCFNEITESAVIEAINNPRTIDLSLVNAQQARRILDRLVGFSISPILWEKIRTGLSAGRVQSVAVKLVIDRENEIKAFSQQEFWNVYLEPTKEKTIPHTVTYTQGRSNEKMPQFVLDGLSPSEKGSDKLMLPRSENETKEIINKIKDEKGVVVEVENKEEKVLPKPPLTTSTLQQLGVNKLKISSTQVMQIAQKLYENGYITYMRTDSNLLSQEAISSIRKLVKSKYGEEYIPQNERKFHKTSSVAQEAHEAIRPTHFEVTPEEFEKLDFDASSKLLYTLIWKRAVASQMSCSLVSVQKITLQFAEYIFKARGQQLKFNGFKILDEKEDKESYLPDLHKGDTVYINKLIGLQNFTTPPSRYSEATLIKALEKSGVGRPSTYASIMSTIINRGYIQVENHLFIPTEIAYAVIGILEQFFPEIIDLQFTANMEKSLDDIANNKKDYLEILNSFFSNFEKEIENSKRFIKKEDYTNLNQTDKKCPLCGSTMQLRSGKYGKFASCSRYPDCKGVINLEETKKKKVLDVESTRFTKKYETAPSDSAGEIMVLRKGKAGYFWASKDFAKHEIKPLLLKEKCPTCGQSLVEMKTKSSKFLGCSGYPNCKYTKFNK